MFSLPKDALALVDVQMCGVQLCWYLPDFYFTCSLQDETRPNPFHEYFSARLRKSYPEGAPRKGTSKTLGLKRTQ